MQEKLKVHIHFSVRFGFSFRFGTVCADRTKVETPKIHNLNFLIWKTLAAQKTKFSIKNCFSKYDQIRSFLQIWSHLLKKSLTENFIFLCSARKQSLTAITVFSSIHVSISLFSASKKFFVRTSEKVSVVADSFQRWDHLWPLESGLWVNYFVCSLVLFQDTDTTGVLNFLEYALFY